MRDLEQMDHWWTYLWFCFSDGIASVECNSRWSILVLAGFVVALLIFVLAGYLFFKVHREIRRQRVSEGARDITATEKLVDDQAQTGRDRIVRVLAGKYRKAFERSGLDGWRIHGDK